MCVCVCVCVCVLEMRVIICVRFTLQNAVCCWSVVTCHLAACLVAAVSPNVPSCIILGFENVGRLTFFYLLIREN